MHNKKEGLQIMPNYVAIIISGVSVAIAIYFGMVDKERNQKLDDKKDASDFTTVIVKLENIGSSINKIESKMDRFEVDRKEDRERLIKLEASVKSAWKRIDIIEGAKTAEEEV
jgi:hypothetical protein